MIGILEPLEFSALIIHDINNTLLTRLLVEKTSSHNDFEISVTPSINLSVFSFYDATISLFIC